jgi:ubiquinone/menaquinone biosynthesis C-methylase UbiE
VTSNLRRYERIAPLYNLLDLPFEYSRYRKIRPLLFRGLKGRLLDAGVGTGRNIPFYPPKAQVVGIDISPAMLVRAERRRLSLGVDVELYQMDVTASCFSQCSIYIALQHEEKADRSESVLALAEKTVSTNREAYTLR